MPREYKVRSQPKMRPPHPGSILKRDVLPALNVSVAQASRELGVSRQLLHGILAEKLPLSADMAVRLGKWCGNGAHLWIAPNAQRHSDTLGGVKGRRPPPLPPLSRGKGTT